MNRQDHIITDKCVQAACEFQIPFHFDMHLLTGSCTLFPDKEEAVTLTFTLTLV